jgi:hypothetical protein
VGRGSKGRSGDPPGKRRSRGEPQPESIEGPRTSPLANGGGWAGGCPGTPRGVVQDSAPSPGSTAGLDVRNISRRPERVKVKEAEAGNPLRVFDAGRR